MELRQLQSFLAVYETGGFRAAAHREHLTQSAVSRQIQQLERSLGVILFVRNPRVVTPTPTGRALYTRVAPLVRGTIDALEATRQGQLEDTLRVGYIAPALAGALPKMVDAVRVELPLLQLDLNEHDSAGVVEGLREGELDIGFFASDDAPTDLRATAIMPIFYGIAVSIDDELAQRSILDVTELEGRTFISLAAREPIHQRILDVVTHACPGLTVQTAFGFGAIQSLVHDGVGVAPIPLVAMTRIPAGITLLETEPALPSSTLWAATRRGRTSPSASRVFDLIAGNDSTRAFSH